MKLSQVKSILNTIDSIQFILADGTIVPKHFHITEVGQIDKKYIDCGGTVRKESAINFQLWSANDFDHRLDPQKLLNIIELSEKVLGIEDFEIEVEYQSTTIGKYNLDFNGKEFVLLNKKTACLAEDQCGIPTEKQNPKLTDTNNEPCCSPEGNCC